MFPRARLWLALLSLFCLEVLAGGLPGGLERVHLWEAYDLAWDWKGKDQTYLFPNFQEHKKIGKILRYPAADPSGRLTFQEFMLNMDSKPCTVQPPGEGRDTMTVAKELDAAGFNKDINGKGFNRGLESKAVKEGKSYYFVLHEMVASMVEDMSKDEDFLKKTGVTERIERMKKIPEMIVSIRKSDFGSWLKADLTRATDATKTDAKGKEIPNPGFGLKDSEVIMFDPAPKNEFDGKTYDKVNVDETVKKMRKNPDYDKNKRSDFRKYANKYGDVNWGPKDATLKFTDVAVTHFQTLSMWERIQVRFSKCLA
ncbi:hypothetical protein LMH87_001243 [Akanthomyces muscarius]|uniref:Uncharacterized protein n=1 Tax=Akanthomyces muscarius TaxID=2231603 RepID=A0A9W8QG60_AKAMU|nr:hypothetical protein LMH87_001243 [Akanthomyces muscarius]KAJ4156029.1 hypothetical protein LMH87_001243 [Akanthomyces muscarius]